jgi:hypothetical protein
VVALRKRNLSVYDIQRELAAGEHPISIPCPHGTAARGGLRPLASSSR